ncbi:hypothetical protein [uncultured Tyzzerella sp.]|uniref:hypothetical protein n=1 Tax=uncultured Tyzzerella sp. TaxID=2321398 RepID=UPI002943AA00|nr:hypothetical protein [uncultured Tyzzerella sp.]
MQENNVIYEIAQKMQDKQVIENDIKEAFGLITNLFKTKYIDKINLELKNNIDNLKKNPSKEIALLNAIKPFILEENHKNIDNAINIVTNVSALSYMIPKNIQNNVVKVNTLDVDPSVKEDGVYDIDENCLFSINNSFNMSNNVVFLVIILLLFKL